MLPIGCIEQMVKLKCRVRREHEVNASSFSSQPSIVRLYKYNKYNLYILLFGVYTLNDKISIIYYDSVVSYRFEILSEFIIYILINAYSLLN